LNRLYGRTDAHFPFTSSKFQILSTLLSELESSSQIIHM
jgi:hypothetical protein